MPKREPPKEPPKEPSKVKDEAVSDGETLLPGELPSDFDARVNRWCPSEDAVLAVGAQNFGAVGNWETISGVYFHNYMDKNACKNRYSQMTRQTQVDNTLRRFRILRERPFTEQEDKLILEGAKAFSLDWFQVRQVMLKHRDPASIGKRYQEIRRMTDRADAEERKRLRG